MLRLKNCISNHGHRGIRWISTELPKTINQLYLNPPELESRITVHGYVKSVRSLKKIAFIDLSDGSSYKSLMCIVSPKEASLLKTGQSISVTGLWIKSKGTEQPFELKVLESDLKLIGDVPETYPLQKKLHSLQFLRTLPTLRWKTSYLSSILRFRSYTDSKLHEFFQLHGFIKTNPPIITGSDCEGAGELFQVESKSVMDSQATDSKVSSFYGKNAYLTVSTQLHLEVLSAALGNVWSLSPTFRAEASDTNRHLSEFWMLEAELAFITDVHQITKFTESMIKYVVKDLVQDKNDFASNVLKSLRTTEDSKQVAEKLKQRWTSLYVNDWNTITYKEAINILQKSNQMFQIQVKYEDGLATEHEKWLAGEYFKGPVFVTDYPKEMKPFYMKVNADNETVGCFDLLMPELGEIIGGSIREHDSFMLKNEIVKRGMKIEDLEWYLSLRENATIPHGGFGLGFERLICYLTGTENVRDVVPFPRANKECQA